MDFLKGWKTLVFATITGGILIIKGWTTGEIAADAPTTEVVQTAIDAFEVVLGLVITIGGWVLRAVTSAPIFNRPPKDPVVNE